MEDVRGNQARIISKLQRVESSVRRAQGPSFFLPTDPDAVALADQLARVKRLLLEGGAQYVAILGMGGIGKTTLARAVVNDPEIKSRFADGQGFVVVAQRPCITECQKKIWGALVGSEENVDFKDDQEGQLLLQGALEKKCVLLILDDVWDKFDMTFLQFVSTTSRVIITSRNAEVARFVGAEQHDVTALGSEDSKELFCRRAFEGKKPSKWQEEYVREIVQECAGLPLALELMGSAAKTYKEVGGSAIAKRTEKMRWKKAVQSLKDGSFGSEVFRKVFHLSFNSLGDLHKEALLDLASLPEDYHIRSSDMMDLWTSKGLSVDDDVALDVLRDLEDKSLIIRTGMSVLGVLEFQASAAEHYHLHDVVRDCALALIEEKPVSARDRLVLPRLKVLPNEARSLKATHISISQSGQQKGVLQDLQLPELRVLMSRGGGLSNLPVSLLITHLVTLDITSSRIVTLPSEISCLQSLRLLRVDDCGELRSLSSELSALVQLQILSMRHCYSIFEIPCSMKNLAFLEKCIAPSCSFAHLPLDFDCLQHLSILDLSFCAGLKDLPGGFGGLPNLKAIDLSGCWQLSVLPMNIRQLTQLEILLLAGCSNLTALPDSLTCLCNLLILDVQECCALSSLPESIGIGCCNLETLRLQMDLEDCKMMGLPKSVDGLENLEVLGLPMRECSSGEMPSMTISEICGKKYSLPTGWTLPGSLIERLEDGGIKLEQESTLSRHARDYYGDIYCWVRRLSCL